MVRTLIMELNTKFAYNNRTFDNGYDFRTNSRLERSFRNDNFTNFNNNRIYKKRNNKFNDFKTFERLKQKC